MVKNFDISDSDEAAADRMVLIEIAEAAIRLAEAAEAGESNPGDLETLSMLLESVR